MYDCGDGNLLAATLRHSCPTASPQRIARLFRSSRSGSATATGLGRFRWRVVSTGQTCVALEAAHRPRAAALIRRCTYGIVRTASIQVIPQGPALVLAVQPLESWRELWVFHERAGSWTIDVLSPALENPEEGYVDFAGYAPGTGACSSREK